METAVNGDCSERRLQWTETAVDGDCNGRRLQWTENAVNGDYSEWRLHRKMKSLCTFCVQ